MIPRFPLQWIAFAACLGATTLCAEPTEIQMLSGHGPDDAVEWEFFCTGGRNSGVWTKIPVPSCWEQQGFGTYNYGVHHRPSRARPNPPPLADEQGRYRREFTVPAAWRGRRVRIVFEGSMTDTEVRLNGQSAGPVHQGSFYRFHYDITDLLRLGEPNRLEVTVSKKSANESVNRAERLGDYWIFGGIFRPVWLEARPADAIEWTGIDARADGKFFAEVNFAEKLSVAAFLEARIEDWDGVPVGDAFSVEVPSGATRARLSTKVGGIRPWTAETPHLYKVHLRLSPLGDDIVRGAHAAVERFGFRTFEVRKEDGLYLNGTKIILKGVNRHCFNPETGRTISRGQSYADARLIKEMNMNAVRMSHYPPDRHFLEACDELGLYVLNELAGWQGAYDTPTATRLIGQLVRRDVNHPSILFWDNGNEGGWNPEVDGEFAKWDPQRRPVLHPWALFSDVDTDHYEPWESHVKKSAGPTIYLPTEMLHGLYDGGIGAGLSDYWDVMTKSPTAAGGFFWVFADEGIVRTDQGGRIDNAGNLAPDGIVGPHGEKEGSCFTVKEIWSPVQVRFGSPPGELEMAENGANWIWEFAVENHFDFTNLKDCTFAWELIGFGDGKDRGKRVVVASGQMPGPDVAPGGGRGRVVLGTPYTQGDSDRLFLSVRDPAGRTLWTASHFAALRSFVSPRKPRAFWAATTGVPVESLPPDDVNPTPEVTEDGVAVEISSGQTTVRFSKRTGMILAIQGHKGSWPLVGGPRLLAMRREDRKFVEVGLAPKLIDIHHEKDTFHGTVRVRVEYAEPRLTCEWSMDIEGTLNLRYQFEAGGVFDILGIRFDWPVEKTRAKRWLGLGPYRVWANRQEGGIFDVHQVSFNDSVPGESFVYPEFAGYFGAWDWLELAMPPGRLVVENTHGGEPAPFFGLGKPRDGVDGLLDLPDVGLAFLHVIPAMRNKFHTTDQLGPQSLPRDVKGAITGKLVFRFEPQ